MGSRQTLTPEQMVLQTPAWHELVDEEALFVLEAVANELHKVGVRQRSKVVHFSLHAHHRKHRVIYTEKKLNWHEIHIQAMTIQTRLSIQIQIRY